MGLKLWAGNYRPSHDCQTAEQGKTSENWRRKVLGLSSASIIKAEYDCQIAEECFLHSERASVCFLDQAAIYLHFF